MGQYDALVNPTAVEMATPQEGLATRWLLSGDDTLVTIDNGKPGGTILLQTIATEIVERRGMLRVERHRKRGASTGYHALDSVVGPRTLVIGALGD